MVSAMFRAARAFYLFTLVLLSVALLFPSTGWVERVEEVWGEGRVVEVALGFVLLGTFSEHLLGAVTRHRQGTLARALLRLQPILRHKGAIEILIRALESENDQVASTAHRELQRITQQDLPPDPASWREWLRGEERAATK